MSQEPNNLEIIQKHYQQKQTEEKLRKENLRLEQEIIRMRRSFSWRITLPLRVIRVMMRKVITLAHLLQQNIKLEGSIKNFVTVARAQIKQFGFSSFLYDFKRLNVARLINYDFWTKTYDSLSAKQIQLIKQNIPKLNNTPTISIVVPIYNPNLNFLQECIESITGQLYPNWELCLADDASTDTRVRTILTEYSVKDPRIKIIFRDTNGHISAATNSALSLATGQWIAFLDQDDYLTEDALFWAAYSINKHPHMALFYSDEDKLEFRGNRCEPHFKSDFNLELLLGYNYFNHLSVIKKSLVDQVSGLREGYEGAQDYDLILRILDHIKPNEIIHFPKILYHWRMMIGGTALDAGEKSYVKAAGEKVLNEYFSRNKINAFTNFNSAMSAYETHYAIDNSDPLISIIIPTKNGHELVSQCIASIYQKSSYKNFEIILIDNNSDDPQSLALFAHLSDQHANLTVLNDSTTPFNFSKINNNAAYAAKGEYLLFLNNDTEVINEEWLTEMLAVAQQQGVGAVGAKLLYPNDTLQHAGVVTGISGIAGVDGVAGHTFKLMPHQDIGYMARTHLMQCYSAVTAACLLVSKAQFFAVGGFNEQQLAVAFNDVDLCLKLKAMGLRNIWTPYAQLYHYESISRGADDDSDEKIERFSKEACYMYDTWATHTQEDPYYNPNLSRIEADFSVAKPRIDLFAELQSNLGE